MVIYARKLYVFVRQVRELIRRRIDIDAPCPRFFKQLLYSLSIHRGNSSKIGGR
jgi:hypothetical protein